MSLGKALEEPTIATYTSDELITRTVSMGTGGSMQDSDRNLKENFKLVDTEAVLSSVTKLPLTTWNYKEENDSVRHIGPMAQDFQAAFHVGEDNRHIHTIDASGVSLAAIQALAEQGRKQSERILLLESRLNRLDDEVVTLRAHQYVNSAI